MENIESYVKAKEYFQKTFAPERMKVINELISLRDDIQKEARIQKIGSVTYSGVGIVGGGMAIAGIVAAPFTLGGSLALTAAGVAAGLSSGVAGVTHGIVKVKIVQSKLADAQKSLQEHDRTCSKMSIFLVPLKQDVDRLQEEILAIQQSRSQHDPENRNATRIVRNFKTLVGSMSTLNVQALAANSKVLSKLLKIGTALEGVVSPSVSTAVKGAAKIGTKALGTLVAVGILVDLGSLISDAVDLAEIEKGKLCDEAERLDNIITAMQNQYADLSKCFE